MSEFEQRVATSVKTAVDARGITTKQIATAIGAHVESVRRRHRKELPWTLAELDILGGMLGIDPSEFTART